LTGFASLTVSTSPMVLAGRVLPSSSTGTWAEAVADANTSNATVNNGAILLPIVLAVFVWPFM
jgi:hypothetical protein